MQYPWWLTAVLLGLVEGATEFIPVSSTGHLIVVSDWLGFVGDTANTFVVFIQLGAILAIVWLYRVMLARVAFGWYRDPMSQQFLLNVGIAFVPAAVAGLLLHRTIKAYLFNPVTVAFALVAGGLLILLIERRNPVTRVHQVADMPWRLALGVGLAQMLALFPGVSRSAATIMGGYSLGLSRRAATEFSFFLAIPVMFAATIFDLVDSRDLVTRADAPLFAVGFVVSFVSALVVVRAFLVYVARHTFNGFAYYRIAFGSLLLAFHFLNGG
jgi:undecaprenyl-diphosphatase